MSSIKPIGDKKNRRFRVHYRTSAGQGRSKTFAREVDARTFLTDREYERNRGTLIDPARGKLSFGDFADAWLTHPRPERASTRARDESYLRSHVRPYFGSWRLCEIARPDVQRWAHTLSERPTGGRGRPLAPATVHKVTQVLAKVLEEAVFEGRLAVNPARGLRLPKVADDEARFLTSGELLELEDAMPEQYRVLVPFLADTGLRIGECAGLRWADLDPLAGLVHVREVLVEVRGQIVLGPPKTAAGRRAVPTLTQEIARRIEPMRAAPTDPVFTGPEGGWLRPSLFRRRVWLPAVTKAGLAEPRPTPHSLRHTAIAHWIAAGVDPYRLAKWAGHRSVASIYRIYGHLLDTDAQDERAALSAIRSAAILSREEPAKVLRLADSRG